jgi:flagellar motor switch protein FliG
MSHYRLDITGRIQLDDYSIIQDYLALVEDNDKFNIMFKDVETENVDIICNIISSMNFTILSKNMNKMGNVEVEALKNNVKNKTLY